MLRMDLRRAASWSATAHSPCKLDCIMKIKWDMRLLRPVARDAREAREAEGVTQTQHRHARDNESVESFGTAARQAMLEDHVSPMNIHVHPQHAFLMFR